MKVSLELQAKGIPEYTRDMRNAEGATGGLDRATDGLAAATDRFAGVLGGMVTAGALAALVKETVDAALAMERLDSRFTAAAGSAPGAAREIAFVRQEVNRLGLEFLSTSDQYGRFLAATRNTPAEGEPARRIFVGVSEAVTALKLSSDEANGVFTALTQMLSKGKVQAEELTGQLGERLPGALDMAARAMGRNRAELLKQVEAGEVMASDLLPKLAEELHKTYGDAATQAAGRGQGAINRFKNEVLETSAAVGEHLTPAMAGLADVGTASLKEFRRQLEEFEKDNWADRIWRVIGAVNAAASPFSRLPVESFRENDARALDARIPTLDPSEQGRLVGRQGEIAYLEERRNAERARKEKEALDRMAQQRTKASEIADIYARLDKQVRATDGSMDTYSRRIADVNAEIDLLTQKKGVSIERLEKYRATLIANIEAEREYAQVLATRAEIEDRANLAGAEFAAMASRSAFQNRAADGYLRYDNGDRGYSLLNPPQSDQGFSLLNPQPSRDIGGRPAEFSADNYRNYLNDFGTPGQQEFQSTVDRVDDLGTYLDQQLITQEEYWAKVEEEYQKHDERMGALEGNRMDAALSTMSSTMSGMAELLMEGSREQFEIGKGLAIASAVIETYAAAVKAYSAMASIPYVGPALGAVAAAAAIAAGTARVAMIESMDYNPRRALGGPTEPGVSYIVGERGPELFTPDQRGTVVPNAALGGGARVIRVTNVWQISTGVSQTVQAEVMRLMPAITSRSVAAVKAAVNSGDMARGAGR